MTTPTIIADIGSNHNQDPERAVCLVRYAKSIGCDAVKAQLFDERLHRDPAVKERLARTKLSTDMVSRIYHACRDVKIPFHCTPFHPDLVEFLDPFVDEFKVGSYEILWLDLIRACAKTRKPLGISTGGAVSLEIVDAYAAAREFLPPEFVTLYHCSPYYPAPYKTVDLHRMGYLRQVVWPLGDKQAPQRVGYSDHTCNEPTVLAAAALGACSIEFHLDLRDGKGAETHHGHVWVGDRAADMIARVRQVADAVARFPLMPDLTQRHERTDPKDGARPLLINLNLEDSKRNAKEFAG